MKNEIEKKMRESISVKEACIKNTLPEIEKSINTILDCYRNGGKIAIFGNGGSAADAQHIACEFVSKFRMERHSLPAIAFNANTSIITAVANDYSFERIFEKQVEGLVNKGDVVIGITTSGNSPNVIRGIEKANAIGAKTVALTGGSGGKIANVAEITIKVPSDDTPRIQESHITIGHIICEIVERELFGEDNEKGRFS